METHAVNSRKTHATQILKALKPWRLTRKSLVFWMTNISTSITDLLHFLYVGLQEGCEKERELVVNESGACSRVVFFMHVFPFLLVSCERHFPLSCCKGICGKL